MPRRLGLLSVACLSTTFSLLSLTGSAHAQNRPEILPREGQKQLQALFTSQKSTLSSFVIRAEGVPPVLAEKNNPEHEKAINAAAQWYTYRLTWEPLDEGADKKPAKYVTDYGVVDELMKEFNAQVALIESDSTRKLNPVYCEMYLKSLAQRAREVMLSRKTIAVVNSARMLSRLAKAGSEDAADACLEAIKNENNLIEPTARLGAQYWALEGLGEILARWGEVEGDHKAKEAQYVAALDGVIGQFMPADRKLPPELPSATPEELAGLRLYRRQAVKALAQYRGPAIADEKDNLKVKSALTLLKVINNEGLVPPAKIDEQIEAAWGVARVHDKMLKTYQPAYAARQVGAVVVQMAANARKNDKKFPWKYHAARLADALEVMRAEAKDDPNKAAEYINPMVTEALRVLKEIETLETLNAAALNDWLGKTPLPGGVSSLYKNDPTSLVLPPGETPPMKPMEKPGEKPGTKPGKS